MKEHLFKRISIRTGLSVLEVMNMFTVTAAIVRQDLVEKEACTVPFLGRFFVKHVPRRKMKLMDFKTKAQRIVMLPPRSVIKFEINPTIRSMTKVEPESIISDERDNTNYGQPINIE
jgi:nucleoid DNA-binding protein